MIKERLRDHLNTTSKQGEGDDGAKKLFKPMIPTQRINTEPVTQNFSNVKRSSIFKVQVTHPRKVELDSIELMNIKIKSKTNTNTKRRLTQTNGGIKKLDFNEIFSKKEDKHQNRKTEDKSKENPVRQRPTSARPTISSNTLKHYNTLNDKSLNDKPASQGFNRHPLPLRFKKPASPSRRPVSARGEPFIDDLQNISVSNTQSDSVIIFKPFQINRENTSSLHQKIMQFVRFKKNIVNNKTLDILEKSVKEQESKMASKTKRLNMQKKVKKTADFSLYQDSPYILSQRNSFIISNNSPTNGSIKRIDGESMLETGTLAELNKVEDKVRKNPLSKILLLGSTTIISDANNDKAKVKIPLSLIKGQDRFVPHDILKEDNDQNKVKKFLLEDFAMFKKFSMEQLKFDQQRFMKYNKENKSTSLIARIKIHERPLSNTIANRLRQSSYEMRPQSSRVDSQTQTSIGLFLKTDRPYTALNIRANSKKARKRKRSLDMKSWNIEDSVDSNIEGWKA